jgi:glutamate racemase
MWVPLIENNEIDSEGANFFVRKNIENIFAKDKSLDTLILGCTHYPILLPLIKKYVPENVNVLVQGEVVSEKLINYLFRHPEMEKRISKGGRISYQTTESSDTFENKASLFLKELIHAKTIQL